jgi:hypothetical protein
MDNGRSTKWEEFYTSHYYNKKMFSIGHLVDKGIITTQNINNCIIKTQMAKGRS